MGGKTRLVVEKVNSLRRNFSPVVFLERTLENTQNEWLNHTRVMILTKFIDRFIFNKKV